MWNTFALLLLGGCLMSDVEHLILTSVSHSEDSAVVEYLVQDSAEEVIESEPTPEEFVIQGMRFIHISAGAFQMGSPESENGRQPHPNDSAEVAIESLLFSHPLRYSSIALHEFTHASASIHKYLVYPGKYFGKKALDT